MLTGQRPRGLGGQGAAKGPGALREARQLGDAPQGGHCQPPGAPSAIPAWREQLPCARACRAPRGHSCCLCAPGWASARCCCCCLWGAKAHSCAAGLLAQQHLPLHWHVRVPGGLPKGVSSPPSAQLLALQQPPATAPGQRQLVDNVEGRGPQEARCCHQLHVDAQPEGCCCCCSRGGGVPQLPGHSQCSRGPQALVCCPCHCLCVIAGLLCCQGCLVLCQARCLARAALPRGRHHSSNVLVRVHNRVLPLAAVRGLKPVHLTGIGQHAWLLQGAGVS